MRTSLIAETFDVDGRNVAIGEEHSIVNYPDMRHTAIDVDWKAKKFRVGSCVPWALAIIVMVLSGHILPAVPAMLPTLLKWVREKRG